MTAITAAEAESAACCSGGRYKADGVAAEVGRPSRPKGACPRHTYVRDVSCRLLKQSELAPMTVSSPNVIEIKLDRLIDDMRLLRSQMIACDRQLKEIEAYLKPSEQQPESKSRPWFAAAVSAMARTVLILFTVGAATSAALFYLGT